MALICLSTFKEESFSEIGYGNVSVTDRQEHMIIGLKSLSSLVHAQFHMGQKLCLVLVSEIPFPYLVFLLRQRKR